MIEAKILYYNCLTPFMTNDMIYGKIKIRG